jgi:hypothetical protein
MQDEYAEILAALSASALLRAEPGDRRHERFDPGEEFGELQRYRTLARRRRPGFYRRR